MAPRKAVTVRTNSSAGVRGRSERQEPWREHARQMAERLFAAGHIPDLRWRDAFACTPRHLLLPGTDPIAVNGEDASPEWLDAVYTDDQFDDDPAVDMLSLAAPSQPTPAVLAWLLGLLVPTGATADGRQVRVLEVGAGRGYTTALLCARLGAEQVTATDPHHADHTRALLAGIELFPCLVSAQGVRGAAVYGPFDAILCTTARADAFSPAWLGQLADDGRIVTAVRGPDARVAANVYTRISGTVSSRTVTRDHARTAVPAGPADVVRAGAGAS